MKKKLDENDGPTKKKKRGKKNSNYCGATEEQVENIEDCSPERETERQRTNEALDGRRKQKRSRVKQQRKRSLCCRREVGISLFLV
jgi:hypothetical protein